jgi:hypothetical protein
MGMDKAFTLRISSDEEAMIEAEQNRMLAEQGLKITKSQAIRSMMYRSSTITDEPGGKPKSITSHKFKQGKK